MVSLFLLLGCNLSYIVDLFAAFHELASASASTLLKLASSVRALLKPYGDTLTQNVQLLFQEKWSTRWSLSAPDVKFISCSKILYFSIKKSLYVFMSIWYYCCRWTTLKPLTNTWLYVSYLCSVRCWNMQLFFFLIVENGSLKRRRIR